MATSAEILAAIKDGSFALALDDASDYTAGHQMASKHEGAAFGVTRVLQKAQQDFERESLSTQVDTSDIERLLRNTATMAAIETIVEAWLDLPSGQRVDTLPGVAMNKLTRIAARPDPSNHLIQELAWAISELESAFPKESD